MDSSKQLKTEAESRASQRKPTWPQYNKSKRGSKGEQAYAQETKKKPQKTPETIGQSLSESKHTATHEDFPGKLIGSQNKASEAEGTTPMPRENKPRPPSKNIKK